MPPTNNLVGTFAYALGHCCAQLDLLLSNEEALKVGTQGGLNKGDLEQLRQAILVVSRGFFRLPIQAKEEEHAS